MDQLYGARKKIIATSNLVPKDIYAFEPRIMSRLTEVCALVNRMERLPNSNRNAEAKADSNEKRGVGNRKLVPHRAQACARKKYRVILNTQHGRTERPKDGPLF